MELRPATPADADALSAVIVEGFESYRAFAPAGWEPPAHDLDPAPLRERLAQPWLYCELASERGEVLGHVGVMPSEEHGFWPERRPGLAHLWQLFVRRGAWGTGVAAALHARAIADTAARGFDELRLYTPAGQARARRFYEREGWTVRGAAFDEARLGMPVVEYRRAVTGG